MHGSPEGSLAASSVERHSQSPILHAHAPPVQSTHPGCMLTSLEVQELLVGCESSNDAHTQTPAVVQPPVQSVYPSRMLTLPVVVSPGTPAALQPSLALQPRSSPVLGRGDLTIAQLQCEVLRSPLWSHLTPFTSMAAEVRWQHAFE